MGGVWTTRGLAHWRAYNTSQPRAEKEQKDDGGRGRRKARNFPEMGCKSRRFWFPSTPPIIYSLSIVLGSIPLHCPISRRRRVSSQERGKKKKKTAFDFIWFCLVFSFSVEISFITSIFYCEFKWGCLFFFYGVSYSRGLAATRDLRRGELVLRVPKAVLLTRESVLNKDQKLAVSVNKYPHLSSTQVGFLSVAYWYCLLFLLSVRPTLLIIFHFSFCFLYFICYPRVIC